MTNQNNKERELPFLTEEAEAGLKKAVNSPAGIAVRVALGAYCVFGLILPGISKIVQPPATADSTSVAQDTKQAPRTTGRVSRGPCTNYTIDQLAELTTFNPDAMASRNGENICIRGGGEAGSVKGNELRVDSYHNFTNYVYCRPSQDGFIRTLNELRPNQQIYTLSGRLNVRVGSFMNVITIEDCTFLRAGGA